MHTLLSEQDRRRQPVGPATDDNGSAHFVIPFSSAAAVSVIRLWEARTSRIDSAA
ncbi:Uncharacterised protein [Mycobacteroides abscessus subsp. abscessus]|nr:hypothetical protein MMAS_46360 [Mycobacteroides abscessus subsp. massiliense CCUG 48898 = JCM 15300]SIN59228.1 Uncharacterised protein [Mycobacteroides abscessus subsp. abscessus]